MNLQRVEKKRCLATCLEHRNKYVRVEKYGSGKSRVFLGLGFLGFAD